MKFRVGQYVRLDPKILEEVDTQQGIVEAVVNNRGVEMVSVYWFEMGRDDGGPWRANWLVLV
jgi:hypothetical protein